MKCETQGCTHTAEYHVSGVLMRGQYTPGINRGGFFYTLPTSATGTETEDLSVYACEEHSTREHTRESVAQRNTSERRRVQLRQQEPSPLGAWRVAEYKRERLPY